jgi:3-dehydroquinate dehydratase-2
MTALSIIHGPNLNLLGEREPHFYGSWSLDGLHIEIADRFPNVDIRVFQSNHEGEIVDAIQAARDWASGIIINGGALSHTSYAIHDAIKAVKVPCVEVHISNVYAREAFRHHSVLVPACVGQISGLGKYSYLLAIEYFLAGGPEYASS